MPSIEYYLFTAAESRKYLNVVVVLDAKLYVLLYLYTVHKRFT